MKGRIVGALLAVALLRSPVRAQEAPALGCRVDPAAELLAALMLLGGPDRPELDYAYPREIRERFAPYADHPAVRRAASMAAAGFDDFVAQLGSRLGPPPALVERRPLRPVGDGPNALRVDSLRALVALARDFAEQSHFGSFLDAHAVYYRALCDRVLADTSLSGAAARTAAFFGTRAARYELALMPLVPRLGVAPPGVRAGPAATLTAYIGPAGVDDANRAFPRFRTGWTLERVVVHEFVHQYVNAGVYASAPALQRSAALLAPVRGRVWRADRIATWTGAVTETVVRAAVAMIRGASAGDAAARAELREQRGFGFTLVDSVAATLRTARTTSGRRGAPWWPAAMRDVTATLDRVAASPRRHEVAEPAFDAVMSQALIAAAPESVAFIVPAVMRDPGRDSLGDALRDSLRAHVRRMRDRYVPGASVLTDREALGRDLRGWTLWAVGTIEDNAWLSAHRAALPVQVDATRIVADSAYRGDGLVFIGAVPSPVDARWPLLLTIGQRLDELARGWWIVGSDYAVMDGTRTLTRGRYVVDGVRRRFNPPNPAVDTAGSMR